MSATLISAKDNVQVWDVVFGPAAQAIKHSLGTTNVQVNVTVTGSAATATAPATAITDANTVTIAGTEADTCRVWISALQN